MEFTVSSILQEWEIVHIQYEFHRLLAPLEAGLVPETPACRRAGSTLREMLSWGIGRRSREMCGGGIDSS